MHKTRVMEIGARSIPAEWEQVDQFTYRLIDPDDQQMQIPRCHGHWPGRLAPIPVAIIFDVGIDSPDWRVRVRRGDSHRAYGCFADLTTAKRFAAEEVAKGSGVRRKGLLVEASQ